MSLPFSALPACGMASFPQKQCYYNPWVFQNQPNLALPGFFKGTVTGCVNFLNESMIIIFNVLRILERNTSFIHKSSKTGENRHFWRRFPLLFPLFSHNKGGPQNCRPRNEERHAVICQLIGEGGQTHLFVHT